MTVLSLVYRPVVFYRARLTRPPSWWSAIGGPLGCAVLAGVCHALFTARLVRPVYAALASAGGSAAFATSLEYMGVLSVASAPVLVWLLSSAFMIAVDVLCRDGDRLHRIVETNALAFYSQMPWLLTVLVLAAVYEPGPSWSLQGDAVTLADIERLSRLMREDPVITTIRVLNECSAAWLYCLFGAGYHVVANLSLVRSLLLTIGMYSSFHLIRYAL